ncbi:methyltransferase-like protein 25 isoform X2 [Choloepus didactylus]|uniref:methyltransferase-like protein 25 isoform X2 n=1 Tax=Choloepus didactylus TaxID=27675 RepID=UPI0018A07DAD|nr:methyltransferase-like protein 25 isoform X2 [Choloepus didactylus]
MAAFCPLPVTQDLPTLRAKLQDLLRFLRDALPISNAHTVDFYTESVWEQLVDLSPVMVLSVLRRSATKANAETRPPVEIVGRSDIADFLKIFCETSKKLISVEDFALAAEYYSLQNMGICTSFEQLLVALQGNQKKRTGENVNPDEFMNIKKSHEVQAMSELISSITDFCGIKQVIDLGSGKGYLSSFLSLKYGLKVYGIDSSNINTHGAEERNRKLKKHWRVCHSRSRLDVNGLALKMAKEREVQDEIKYKVDVEGEFNNSLINQEKISTSDFFDPVISNIRKQMENLHAQPQQEEKLGFGNGISFKVLLPVNALQPTFSSQIPIREISEENKKTGKTTSKSSESNIYSPLTSFITADSELHDIIQDLEDCLMVGLHTCGDLASNTLRIFTSKSEIKGVCSVGCCYHLLSEEFENQHKEYVQEKRGFPMCHYLKEEKWCCGRNARMSACLALERVAVGQGVPEKIIMDYYEKYKPRMNELEAFNMLKVVLAPCIETLILLDRLCYLKEQEDIAWSALVKLFDPVKSPRCYAVIALKKQQ